MQKAWNRLLLQVFYTHILAGSVPIKRHWHGTCFRKHRTLHYPSSGPRCDVQVLKSYRGPFPRCQGPLKQLNGESGPGLASDQRKAPADDTDSVFRIFALPI